MHYLFNLNNAMRLAMLTMTNVLPSNVVDLLAVSKTGSGNVRLTGDYAGAADATFEVEVQNRNPGSAAQVTAPRFEGIGSGTLEGLTVDGATAAQEFSITLADAGTQTQRARVALGANYVEAIAAGAAGNGIALRIDHAALVSTATPYAVREDLGVGTVEMTGEAWDWGHAQLLQDGTIPPDAPRLRFRDDPQVYRAYKLFRDGQTRYCLSPPVRRPILARTPVLAVSGTRTATVTQGATVETYTGLRSLYDLLTAINGPSALVRVSGVIANDLLPDGMGINDLSVWTSSYHDSITRQGTRYAEQAALEPVIAATAPTERVTIECKRADVPGAEVWGVLGSVSGALADLVTGVAYSAGPLTSLTVPVQVADPVSATGGITWRAEVQKGCAILKGQRLGINAVTRQLKFVWRRRENDDCDCAGIPLQGGPRPGCLGIEIPGGDDMGGTPQVLRIQLDRWAAELGARMRTTYGAAGGGPDADRVLRDALTNARNALSAALDACLAKPLPKWTAETDLALDDIRVPETENGFVYRVKTAAGGVTGTSAPAFPSVIGESVSDGTLEWECVSRSPRALWLAIFRRAQDELQYLGDAGGSSVWTASANSGPGRAVVPEPTNAHWYTIQRGGTSGGGAPTFPTDGSTVEDGTQILRDMGAYWVAEQAIAAGAYLDTHGNGLFVSDAGGTTGEAEPDWLAESVTDGDVIWRRVLVPRYVAVESSGGQPASAADFNTAFGDALRELYAVAGSNFESAGGPGTDCWQDLGGAFWWVCEQGGPYAPAFNNYYYHSVVVEYDTNGNEFKRETREFGFQICACAEFLQEGDVMYIDIAVDGGAGLGTYNTGDRFDINLVRANPLETAGGQDGNGTLTWRIVGSVDGVLADLVQVLADEGTWDYSAGGLEFTIRPGGLAFGVGARWLFSVEGAQFRWRKNGGSWTSGVQVQPIVSLSDGLSAAFELGPQPAFNAGDVWTFAARAINGVDQLRSPLPGRTRWVGGTVIDATPADPAHLVSVLMIADHTIPSGASIVLQGSDDDFATTPTDITVAWNPRHIGHVLPTPVAHLRWRLAISGDGSALWVYLDQPDRWMMRNIPSQGHAVPRFRLPTAGGVRPGTSWSVTHRKVTRASLRAMLAALTDAAAECDGRFGLLTHTAAPEDIELVRLDPSAQIEVTSEDDYTDPDPAQRRHAVELDLAAV